MRPDLIDAVRATLAASGVAADGTELHAPPVVSAVYLLLLGDEVVYVGQSVNVHARHHAHLKGDKEFDRFVYFECPECDLDRVELALIMAFRTRYNRSTNPRAGRPRHIRERREAGRIV